MWFIALKKKILFFLLWFWTGFIIFDCMQPVSSIHFKHIPLKIYSNIAPLMQILRIEQRIWNFGSLISCYTAKPGPNFGQDIQVLYIYQGHWVIKIQYLRKRTLEWVHIWLYATDTQYTRYISKWYFLQALSPLNTHATKHLLFTNLTRIFRAPESLLTLTILYTVK